MPEGLAQRIQKERLRRGWDQAQLARRLGGQVGQQAVSRWERGQSRPRREVVLRLAKVFGADPRELLLAAGYTPLSDNVAALRHSRPLLPVLPLQAYLSPENFENLIADVAAALYPDAQVSRFGGQGHTQGGVDVVVELDSRYIATFQCKRVADFGPKKVREAVSALNVSADKHHLVLSRQTASPDCRQEMQNHPGWTLWDAEDVSRVIRALRRDKALRIVDTYFPHWREPFLGIAEPGPWLRNQDVYWPLAADMYSHKWQLVGRQKELSEIGGFVRDPNRRVGLLVGRGGLGKSRLLREVAAVTEASGLVVRFLKPGTIVKPEHYELLEQDENVLVIVDDAHERDDISAIVGDLLRTVPNSTVLLALRPYGVNSISSDLRRIGVSASDSPTWELTDLPASDATALAAQALGPEHDRLAERLGRLTADCPFVTVVAGVLIRRGDLDPACLNHEAGIRQQVLVTFRDAVLSAPQLGDARLRRDTLDAISAFQPFRADDPTLQNSLAELVGVPYDRLLPEINILEEAGVLLRRGSSLRIVPDILGDVLLTEASFDRRSGASTGYLSRAWATAAGDAVRHLFINAVRVDWQIRHDTRFGSSLTEALWDAIDAAAHAAGIRGRTNILTLVQKAAYFNPSRSLQLVQWMIDHPTDHLEDAEHLLLRLYSPSYQDVVHELSPILREVSYHPEHLRTAADTLWALAKGDRRTTNQFPNHPLRVLQELAALDPTKPLSYNDAMVDAVGAWLRAEVGPLEPSPFDVLEPALATEGTTHSSDGFRLILRPYLVAPDVVRPLRERALGLALTEVRASQISRAVRALDFICAGLHYPIGLLGQRASGSQADAWTPQFVDTLNRLREAVESTNLDPLIHAVLRRGLHWHLGFSATETREAAQRVLDAVPESLESRLALALFDGWGRLRTASTDDLAGHEAETQEDFGALAQEWLEVHCDADAADLLSARLDAQMSARREDRGSAGPFTWRLILCRPSLGSEIVQRIVSDAGSPLLQVLPVVVAAMAEGDPTAATHAIMALGQVPDRQVRRSLALALGWNRGQRSSLIPGELDALAEFATDKDAVIRRHAVTAVQMLGSRQRSEALMLLSQVRFADSAEVAEEVFETLVGHGPLRWDDLPGVNADSILEQLRECPTIEGYWTTQFLSDLSSRDPRRVVDLLLGRIEVWDSLESTADYRALPYHWHHSLQVRQHAEFLDVLRRIRDSLLAQPLTWKRQLAGGELFAAVAQSFDVTVVTLLKEKVSPDPTELAALSAILAQAPRSFVFDHVDFVRAVLDAAMVVDEELLRRVGGALHGSAASGIRTGTPGQPFEIDVEQRDTARSVADTLPRGSAAERFFRSLERSADETIQWHADYDEKFLDGRDW